MASCEAPAAVAGALLPAAPEAATAAAAAAAAPVGDDGLPPGVTRWHEEERKVYFDELSKEEHPLFMDTSPTLEQVESNPYLKMLTQEKYEDGDSPEKLAAREKELGNVAFRGGPEMYGNALKHYKRAIEHAMNADPGDPEMLQLMSQVRSNRAAIYLARKKFDVVVSECGEAIRQWRHNVKAYWRMGKALVLLGQYEPALEALKHGLAVEPTNEAAAARAREEAEAAVEALRLACVERGLRVGPPLFRNMGHYDPHPYMDADGCFHWSVLFLYEEYGQSDFMRDFPEVETIGAALTALLPTTTRAPWDARGDYVEGNLEVYFAERVVRPRPIAEAWTPGAIAEAALEEGTPAPAPASWVRVPHAAPLLLPLVHRKYVIPAFPVFYVYARGSRRHAEFIETAGDIETLVLPALPPRPE